MSRFTIPGLTEAQGAEIAALLQKQLSAYNDLHLTLKHVHWNVVGPSFIGVHEMIDPQVVLVRGYADEVAERIADAGCIPETARPARSIADRTWNDYSLGRDLTGAHMAALDLVYAGIIEDTRKERCAARRSGPGHAGPADRARHRTRKVPVVHVAHAPGERRRQPQSTRVPRLRRLRLAAQWMPREQRSLKQAASSVRPLDHLVNTLFQKSADAVSPSEMT